MHSYSSILLHIYSIIQSLVTNRNLLLIARLITLPFAIIASLLAIYYHSSHSLGATGYLLVVAFDVVLATAVVPLFGAFYTRNPSPLAALCAIITGAFVRVFLEYTLPKDGFVILPFPGDEFLNYGVAASTAYPTFFDQPQEELWDPTIEGQECIQERYHDWTGVDSLASPIAAALVFMFVQWLERNGPIFNFKVGGVMCKLEVLSIQVLCFHLNLTGHLMHYDLFSHQAGI